MSGDRPIDPPERPLTKYEREAGEAAAERNAVAHSMAMVMVLSGRGAFWRLDCEPLEQWDNEQEFAIAAAVREALTAELTPADAWEWVKARVRREGEKYAQWKSESHR